MFDKYEKRFRDVSASLYRKVKSDKKKKKKILEINSGLEDASDLLQKMDLEAMNQSPSKNGRMLSKLREYKADFSNLKTEVSKYSASNDGGDNSSADLEIGNSSVVPDDEPLGKSPMATENSIESKEVVKMPRKNKSVKTQEQPPPLQEPLLLPVYEPEPLFWADEPVASSSICCNGFFISSLSLLLTLAGLLIAFLKFWHTNN